MDIYHIWCDLKPGVGDVDFCQRVDRYLGHLRDEGLIAGHRTTRRKLGLAPADLGEFHIMIETTGLAQLDAAFERVASRAGVVEEFHHHVNSLVDEGRTDSNRENSACRSRLDRSAETAHAGIA